MPFPPSNSEPETPRSEPSAPLRSTVSYDVFDTVVTRAFAHPRDVFVHLGERLGVPDPMEFARTRWSAERATRQHARETRGSPEVSFDEIHAELARRLGWDATAARAAHALELEIESQHLHAVPWIRAELAAGRAEAGKLIFLSDMYLPPAVLRGWLEREGVALRDDVLLVSGDQKANKSSGTLFTAARQQHGGEFAAWRHAGDHVFADVESPRRLSITATHHTHAHLTAREWLARGTREEFAPTWRSLLAGAMRLARLERVFADSSELGRVVPTRQARSLSEVERPNAPVALSPSGNFESHRRVRDNPPYPQSDRDTMIWEIGATVAGPLFYHFVRWTLAEATKRGVRRLYFLARDGQIFLRIAKAIQGSGPQAIECRYLHASRLLFAGPAELDSPAALRLLAAPTGQFHSRRQTLLQLGFDDRDLPAHFRCENIDDNLAQADRDALADWLLAAEQRPQLIAALSRRSAQARDYLADEGLRAGEPIALVDTGWFGTIQRSLEHLLGGPLVGFYLGLMPDAGRPVAGEALGYTNCFSPLPLQREESHKVLIELLARSDEGPATNFVTQGDRTQVQFGEVGPVNLEEIRCLQEAVLTFTHRALAVESVTDAPAAERARVVVELYRNFHDTPTPREARVFGFMSHSDQYFEQRHAPLCADFSWGETLRAIFDFRKRPPHWWIGGQITLGNAASLRTFRFLKKLWWRLRGRAE